SRAWPYILMILSLSDHNAKLAQVLQHFQEYNLTLNEDKCKFQDQEIDFVGYQISSQGVKPLNSNIEAILQLPDPQNVLQLSSFLGMTNYYLCFVPAYADITAPLRLLLKKDAPWDWTPTCQAAIDTLKIKMTSTPTLAHFSLGASTIVTCDASAIALGAVLSQIQGGRELPVAFASRALSPTEQKYSVGEREALACIWACERWHTYLYGRHFILRTDHQALTSLLATSGSGHTPLRISRWSDWLYHYNFTVEFKPGKLNQVADHPSRVLLAATPGPDLETENDLVMMLTSSLTTVITPEEVERESGNDLLHRAVRQYITEGWPKTVVDNLQPFLKIKDFEWHATTGVSPATLMMGRNLRLPLDKIKQAEPFHTPAAIRHKVQQCQEATKQYVDLKRGARKVDLVPLQWVRIKRPQAGDKLRTQFSKPIQIRKQVVPATFILQDGSKWHSSRLIRVAAPPQELEMLAGESWDCATAGETTTENELANLCHGMYATQRPPRTRARPHRFTDFVTDFHT
ncbi:Transposon Tf2-9 polyprotein, partial [Acipenser ruthenus]